ncbi:hypothetical protein PMAYCL1PPCAC_20930, partial [Pristionchus mayeri]
RCLSTTTPMPASIRVPDSGTTTGRERDERTRWREPSQSHRLTRQSGRETAYCSHAVGRDPQPASWRLRAGKEARKQERTDGMSQLHLTRHHIKLLLRGSGEGKFPDFIVILCFPIDLIIDHAVIIF